MLLIKGRLENDTKLMVQAVYNMDAEENKNISTDDGILVEELIPPPPYKRGKGYIHYINPKTKEQWYEEFDRPLTQKELLEIQNEKIDLLLMNQLEMEGIL